MEPNVTALLTVAGLAPIVTLLSQLIWVTIGHNASGDAVQDRYGPIVAVAVGILLAEVALWATSVAGITRVDVFQSGLVGLVGGLAAIGIHDVWVAPSGGSAADG